jgi:hypothetical protein
MVLYNFRDSTGAERFFRFRHLPTGLFRAFSTILLNKYENIIISRDQYNLGSSIEIFNLIVWLGTLY